jgi:hypothetical protein
MTTFTPTRPNLDVFDPLWKVPFGGENAAGYATEGDALVQVLADGTDLNTVWGELRTLLQQWNTERSSIAQLVSYSTTDTASAVPQSTSDESFEVASEFGVPTSLRVPKAFLLLGFSLEDYDRATRFTWKALRSMTMEQVRSATDAVLAADNKLTNGLIMGRLFDNAPSENEWGHTVYPLWSNDGLTPPSFAGKEFTSNHTHYLVSGAAEIDSNDLEQAYENVQEHGYGVDAPSQLIVFAHPDETKEISKFRAGETNNNSVVASYDFVPSAGAPPYLLPVGQQIQGTPAPGVYNGLKVSGSYGPGLIIPSYYVPAGYFAVVATNGPNSPLNPVGFRQHSNVVYQGLRIIPGPQPAYPLQESFFARAAGVGVRHRGAAAVMQIKESGSYVVPTIPL